MEDQRALNIYVQILLLTSQRSALHEKILGKICHWCMLRSSFTNPQSNTFFNLHKFRNIRLSRNFNDWELDALGELLHLLRDLRTSLEEDPVIWKGESHGRFRIRDAYKLLSGSNVITFPKKSIWVDKVPTKVAFFAWEATWEKVLTLDRLQRRGWHLLDRCFLCGCEEENVNHILLHCIVVRAFWEIVLALFGAN